MFSDFIKKAYNNFVSFVKDALYFLSGGYERFVKEHSVSLKKIDELNQEYKFEKVISHDMSHKYDNATFFNEISEVDYLVYQLAYKGRHILAEIHSAERNKELFAQYKSAIKQNCCLGVFDTEDTPKWRKRLIKIEKNIFKSRLQKPCVGFNLEVMLIQTNIKGRYLTYKSRTCNSNQIKELMRRVNDKTGEFYNDKVIWDAICRVERGKVSNKIRFAVYEKYDHSCAKCGRRNVPLEVDHIFPIAKGGKSDFHNLQALCHRCNVLKSDTVEAGVVDPRAAKKKTFDTKNNPICPNCNIPMVMRSGRYGDFFGCQNYPNCKHTEQIK